MTLGGTRLFATALALGLKASRLTHSCAYPCLACALFLRRVAAWDSRGRLSPHKCEVEGGVLPTLACSSNRACSSLPLAWMTAATSYSKDDAGERPF